jgi:hypothetical protein
MPTPEPIELLKPLFNFSTLRCHSLRIFWFHCEDLREASWRLCAKLVEHDLRLIRGIRIAFVILCSSITRLYRSTILATDHIEAHIVAHIVALLADGKHHAFIRRIQEILEARKLRRLRRISVPILRGLWKFLKILLLLDLCDKLRLGLEEFHKDPPLHSECIN